MGKIYLYSEHDNSFTVEVFYGVIIILKFYKILYTVLLTLWITLALYILKNISLLHLPFPLQQFN